MHPKRLSVFLVILGVAAAIAAVACKKKEAAAPAETPAAAAVLDLYREHRMKFIAV